MSGATAFSVPATILIVDDTPANLGVVVDCLEAHGYQVLVAQEGEEGVRRAEFAHPDLILLDVMMPGRLDGFAACRRLKAGAATRDIPVIFMTALADTEHKVAGFAAGAVDYVTKPLETAEVLARVSTQLAASAMRSALEAQNLRLQREVAERRDVEEGLRLLNEKLEDRVSERTAELEAANRDLRLEVRMRGQVEARLRRLVDSNVIGIVFYDLDGGIAEANDAFLDMVGYSRQELAEGRLRWIEMTPREYRAVDEQVVEQLRATGSCRPFEKEYIRKDGDRVPVLIAGALFDGSPDQGVAFVLDLTMLKRAEQALRVAKTEAEQANAAKSRFLATASHDLRQPVQSLMLLTATLAQMFAGQPAAKLAGHIQAAANALKILLDGLLDISRLDAGIIEPRIQDIPLAPLMEQLAQEYRSRAKQKGLELRVVPSRAWLRTDPTLLERILRNLLENALRYTLHGKVLVGCRRRGDTVSVEVHDTGIGIAASQLEAIFEEFLQIDNPERDRSKGLGLGLSIVRRLVRLLGHEIRVRSLPGRGSRFAVLVGAGQPQDRTWDHPCAQARPGGLAVVVDDDEQVRAAMQIVLESWGYGVVAGNDHREVLPQLRGRIPDVIFADLRLRGALTGVEALQQINRALGCTVPAVLLTGDTAPQRIIEAKNSGFGLLHKPVSADTLRGVLDGLRQQMHGDSRGGP